jgi:hypothetical protein
MTTRDSYLRCTVCGRTATTSFAGSLRDGWPKCCGYTMRLERTDADIGGALVDVMQAKLPNKVE